MGSWPGPAEISTRCGRLHKLKGIKDIRLKPLAQAMMDEKRAGYQETILQDILRAIGEDSH
jgi:hypothetical protein